MEYKGIAVIGANVMGRSSVTKTVLISNSSHEGYCSTVGAFIFYVESKLLYKNWLHNANTTLTISECNVFSGQCVEGPNITYGFNSIISIISIAAGVTVEIKNPTFQNTIIDIYTPLTQQDLTNNYNLPKVCLNDDRILNSVLFIALASFSISSSSESQSHFELAAISVIDTDVHLHGNLSFKHSTLSLEGNSHLVLQEPLSAIFVGKQLAASKYCLSVVNTYLYTLRTMCPIQFSTQHVYTPDNITDINIHLTFINTSATAYDYAVHTTTIDNCKLYGNISATPREIYNATFHVANDCNISRHMNIYCNCIPRGRRSNC